MKLHVLRQIAPYPNNSLAQSPSKLIRSHAGDWIGGRHLSYSRIGLPNADHPIIQSAQNQQQHYPVVLIWQIRTLPIIQKGLAFGCERSGTATVPGVSSSSGSCPAGSRSYGRSRRPRQHEAFDCHAFKRNRQEECVQMPVKIARSTPRPSFGLRELLVASHISRLASRDVAKSLLSTLVSELSGECRPKGAAPAVPACSCCSPTSSRRAERRRNREPANATSMVAKV